MKLEITSTFWLFEHFYLSQNTVPCQDYFINALFPCERTDLLAVEREAEMTVALRSIFARYRRRSATFMNDFKWDIKKRSTKGMNGGRFLYYSKRECFFFFPFLQRSSLVILFSSLQEYVMHCWQQKLPWIKHQLISTYILNVLSLKSLQYIQKSTSIGFADLHLECFS